MLPLLCKCPSKALASREEELGSFTGSCSYFMSDGSPWQLLVCPGIDGGAFPNIPVMKSPGYNFPNKFKVLSAPPTIKAGWSSLLELCPVAERKLSVTAPINLPSKPSGFHRFPFLKLLSSKERDAVGASHPCLPSLGKRPRLESAPQPGVGQFWTPAHFSLERHESLTLWLGKMSGNSGGGAVPSLLSAGDEGEQESALAGDHTCCSVPHPCRWLRTGGDQFGGVSGVLCKGSWREDEGEGAVGDGEHQALLLWSSLATPSTSQPEPRCSVRPSSMVPRPVVSDVVVHNLMTW